MRNQCLDWLQTCMRASWPGAGPRRRARSCAGVGEGSATQALSNVLSVPLSRTFELQVRGGQQ